ncbi:acyl carrier protein [Micromonospora sp. NPDC047548]|uniref:acyl carrier protein n=1 Tax=unclassified Micromonospora TaxID=2617518 RepID=UPI0033D8062D
MRQFTIEDLRRIMRQCAGESDALNLDGDILDTSFDDLGYDSLALLETTSRTSQEFAVELPEDGMASATTPRRLLDFINDQLAAKA